MSNMFSRKITAAIFTFTTKSSVIALSRSRPATPTTRLASATLFRNGSPGTCFFMGDVRGFSVSCIRSLPNVSVDKELSVKLAEELKYEKGNEPDSSEPSFIKSFLSENPFKIEDKLGANEVALTRTFGNEKIRLLFDINTSEQQAEPISLGGDEEEDDNEIDDSSQEEEEDDEDDGSTEQSLPVRCSITIEKPGKGALGFESIIADGVFLINFVSYYQDAKLAGDWTAEADWKRRGYYPGPSFETLDNDVQVLFEKYLEERGINTSVALFISNYVEYKEQKEYIKWLENVRKFVDVP
ncbi:9331_t:CDS:2 [Cetraspora pellucida]|uniref:9331_t:CDS:1 n=1 Tax=Cetraspora pellucida TaxID=1433469 RepID=A0ACA9LN82_9GLOM|nr:9331_t:CDS:2 [Cetraspora pellucida]